MDASIISKFTVTPEVSVKEVYRYALYVVIRDNTRYSFVSMQILSSFWTAICHLSSS